MENGNGKTVCMMHDTVILLCNVTQHFSGIEYQVFVVYLFVFVLFYTIRN